MLVNWEIAKYHSHDISGITNPDEYLYQKSSNIYYPAIREIDFNQMKNDKQRRY